MVIVTWSVRWPTNSVWTLFAGETGWWLEQWLIVTPMAIAYRTFGESGTGAVLNKRILLFIAASVDIRQIPGDGKATGYLAIQLVITGEQVFFERLTGEARTLVAVDEVGT